MKNPVKLGMEQCGQWHWVVCLFGCKKLTADLICTSPRHKLEHVHGRQVKEDLSQSSCCYASVIQTRYDRETDKKLPGKAVGLICKQFPISQVNIRLFK